MKNPHKALEAIEVLVGGDFGMDMEFIATGQKVRRPISTLRKAAKMITDIYMIAHAENNHACSHSNWEEIKYKIIKDTPSH